MFAIQVKFYQIGGADLETLKAVGSWRLYCWSLRSHARNFKSILVVTAYSCTGFQPILGLVYPVTIYFLQLHIYKVLVHILIDEQGK